MNEHYDLVRAHYEVLESLTKTYNRDYSGTQILSLGDLEECTISPESGTLYVPIEGMSQIRIRHLTDFYRTEYPGTDIEFNTSTAYRDQFQLCVPVSLAKNKRGRAVGYNGDDDGVGCYACCLSTFQCAQWACMIMVILLCVFFGTSFLYNTMFSMAGSQYKSGSVDSAGGIGYGANALWSFFSWTQISPSPDKSADFGISFTTADPHKYDDGASTGRGFSGSSGGVPGGGSGSGGGVPRGSSGSGGGVLGGDVKSWSDTIAEFFRNDMDRRKQQVVDAPGPEARRYTYQKPARDAPSAKRAHPKASDFPNPDDAKKSSADGGPAQDTAPEKYIDLRNIHQNDDL